MNIHTFYEYNRFSQLILIDNIDWSEYFVPIYQRENSSLESEIIAFISQLPKDHSATHIFAFDRGNDYYSIGILEHHDYKILVVKNTIKEIQ